MATVGGGGVGSGVGEGVGSGAGVGSEVGVGAIVTSGVGTDVGISAPGAEQAASNKSPDSRRAISLFLCRISVIVLSSSSNSQLGQDGLFPLPHLGLHGAVIHVVVAQEM